MYVKGAKSISFCAKIWSVQSTNLTQYISLLDIYLARFIKKRIVIFAQRMTNTPKSKHKRKPKIHYSFIFTKKISFCKEFRAYKKEIFLIANIPHTLLKNVL